MKYVCTVCGWEYDESAGYPEGGIAPGTPWSEVPEDFECTLCGVGKDSFEEAWAFCKRSKDDELWKLEGQSTGVSDHGCAPYTGWLFWTIPWSKYLHPSDDYVSLTDIARKYDAANPSDLIQSWLRSRNTVAFLATWERKHNSNFNEDAFRRITVDAKTPQLTLTPKKWIDLTNAIGIISKQGKSGGTMAHLFIACDFEMRNDAEFRFEVVRAFINSRTEIQNGIE